MITPRCRSPPGMHLSTTAIASSSAIYAFCSSFGPRVTEYLATTSSAPPPAALRTTPPMPTIPFLAEALVAMSTCLMLLVSVTLSPVSTSAAASLSESYFTTMCLCHGGSAYGSIVSIRAITPSWASANFVNGDKYLRVSLTLSSLVPACAWRSPMGRMPASASATAIETVLKAPVIACTPIFCASFSHFVSLTPRRWDHTFEA
ncbi:Uncharacterized protein HZ326_24826 [Fusarium oxysporum f. sp. albedinis]|nr:Uncharacterized protein HZ326_24826 [Fusarium oxysporum f. sp. albedinis]